MGGWLGATERLLWAASRSHSLGDQLVKRFDKDTTPPPHPRFFFFFSLHGVNDFGRLRDSGSPPTSSLAECALKGLMHAYTSLLFTAAGLCKRNGEHKQKV